jgi:hypothetical protein
MDAIFVLYHRNKTAEDSLLAPMIWFVAEARKISRSFDSSSVRSTTNQITGANNEHHFVFMDVEYVFKENKISYLDSRDRSVFSDLSTWSFLIVFI